MTYIADVVAGQVISVSWGNGIRDQGIATFANAASRNVSIPAPTYGRPAYRLDGDVVDVSNGVAWRSLAHRPLYVRKTADESVTSSTVVQNDDQLVLPVVANTTYDFKLRLFVVGNETGKFKCGFTIPASATIDQVQLAGYDPDAGFNGGDTHGAVEFHALTGQTTPTTALSFGCSTTMIGYEISGTLTVATTAGSMQLQWAQKVSNGTATVVKIGSSLKLELVAGP